ncbi:hypothetical protein C0995_013309 [Termitomyces sp. Mi166|nr:hypothetical protein C0995_013309 [Termitomyces sp. Mi166\
MAFQGQPHTLESLRSSGGGGGLRDPPQQRSVWPQGQITQTHQLQGQQQLQFESEYKQRSHIEFDYEQCSYVKNLEAVQDKSLPYSQDESMNEGHYERPQHMRSYASMVMQPMLPVQAEYAQYVHPVDEVLLQRLEWAGQPVSAMVAFLQNDLAIMVVEGLLDQIELMKRQRISMLEQIERVGKRKAPMFEEPMVEPKQARALLQHPQELAWAPAHTVA